MIYFDHNASTPVRPEVRDAMSDALERFHANPSSLHREGQAARAAIERARDQVAALVHASPGAVAFTSGGTEGDHAALIGAALALESRGRTLAFSEIEHHAVHGASNLLSRLGFHETRLAVSPDGFVDPLGVESLPKTCTLVSLMLANNETGVLQPVAEVASRAHARGMRLHCDAVQAAGKVAIDLAALGVDYLVISAHKLCGPKGTGALVLASDAPFEPLFRGSPHELGRRGGTENVAGIVGFGVAAELAARELDEERQRLRVLRERFERALHEAVADVVIHGALAPRLPNTVNASFPGARSDDLLMALDARGIAVSAGAACSSGAVEPSPVLTAMGVSRELAVCSLRFSMGRTTVESEVDEVARAVGECVPAVRSFGEKMR